MGRAYIQDEVWFIITSILLTNYYDNRSLLQLQYTLITVITKLSPFTTGQVSHEMKRKDPIIRARQM